MNKQKAFALIELFIVIIVIAICAALLLKPTRKITPILPPASITLSSTYHEVLGVSVQEITYDGCQYVWFGAANSRAD